MPTKFEKGQGAVEYITIIFLVGVILVVIIYLLSPALEKIIRQIILNF